MYQLLAPVLTFFAEAFKHYFSKVVRSMPVLTAGLALIYTVQIAYLSAANYLLDGIQRTVPQIVVDVYGWFMPSNAFTCLTVIISARILKYVHVQYIRALRVKTKTVAS